MSIKNRSIRKFSDLPSLYIFICVFLLIFLCTSLTPMMADDYSYSFSFYDRSRIENLADIFSSLSVHRIEMNGRMLAHFFAHLFLLLPKPIFNIINALVFSGIIFLLFSWIRTSDKRTNILLLLLIIAMLWLFVPVFGQVFLWLDGA